MAFALKASPSTSSSAALSHRTRRVVCNMSTATPRPTRLVLSAPPPPGFSVVATVAIADERTSRRRQMSVAQTMARLKAQGKTAFIPRITAGDPDLVTTAEALRLLDSIGADVIEVGMPFSDPYADGPVIQASAARALAGGATIDAVMDMLREVTPELSCPAVLVSYLGPVVRRGADSFTAAVRDAGVQGLMIRDLPYAEACGFRAAASQNDLELVLLTTPATPAGRMTDITKASEGFVYLVSVNGVTGPRATVNLRVKGLLNEIKLVTDKAVVVGFGISTPDHVRQVAEWGADGVIIGSAMVKQLGEAASAREGLKKLEQYAKSLKAALS
ncbi:tryptophan synthase alpha chain [Brachypodium distachyon]|uniref:Uncharacterized protein n=1 Tax=Brachypodium distachyon TaxID=15368 RepID=A0A0Q3GQL5_BRADI|nr:tryptophan synthase alpha chain [Brachypodium distachyon]KQK12701.1 hypothetical protein BRADI_1g05460v3 [Brachypodium distachyon]|eukprot:XP_003557400.2 tryptophan synthase alpha chain [Brachypodium distachyon]